MNRRTVSKRFAASVATAALISSGTALAAPAHAAEGPLTVTGVAAVNDGGGLSGHLPINCSVEVQFSDGTPAADASLYDVTVLDQYGTQNYSGTGAYDTDGDPTTLTFSIPCDNFFEDEAHTITVSERSAEALPVEASAPAPFTFEFTDHPSNISDSSYLKNGVWTHKVGVRQTMAFSGGAWEAGTKFSTRVWTSKTASFTPADYEANVSGGAAIVNSMNADAPVLSWTPRGKDAGRYVWISIVGQVPGKGAWRFTFNPHYVEGGVINKAMVKSFGSKRGVAKVGRTVKVTKPVLTTAGKQAGVKASYKWYVKKGSWKPLPGAKSKKSYYKLTKSLKGKKVMVKVTLKATGYKSASKNFTWSKTRR